MKIEAVFFDVVGTVLRPEPSVLSVYRQHAQRLGIEASDETIAARLQAALARHAGDGAPTSEALEEAMWRQVVAATFPGLQNSQVESLFEQLWRHFARPESWRLYSDVEECWRLLVRQPMRLYLASNFDHRLPPICQALPPLAHAERIFTSAEVGYRKPNPEFFRQINDLLQIPPQGCLMIGDQLDMAVHAAQAAGWNALLLLRSPPDPQPLAAADPAVNPLTQNGVRARSELNLHRPAGPLALTTLAQLPGVLANWPRGEVGAG